MDAGQNDKAGAVEMTDMFCRSSNRKVDQWFRELWSNDDDMKTGLAKEIMKDNFTWIEEDRIIKGTGGAEAAKPADEAAA